MNVEFDKIQELIIAFQEFYKDIQVKFRIIDINGNILGNRWTNFMINPTGKYLETSEPIPYGQVKEVHIDPIESRQIGRLVPNKIIDHTLFICKLLEELKINYSIEDRIFKIQ